MENFAAKRLSLLSRQLTFKDLKKKPINVTITGAAGNIGYALVFMIGQGRMFGPNQPVNVTLLEIPVAEKALQGVIMELNDCALPLIRELKGTTDIKEGFTGCQAAVLVGAKPRGPGMERKDLLGQNAKIFKIQGQAINEYADKNCKVVVVGNPANTNAMIVAHFATKIPNNNITALTRLDQNRAAYQIASKIGVGVEKIKNIVIWGNHSATQVPDVGNAYAVNYPQEGKVSRVKEVITDSKWLESDFFTTVQKRGAAIIAARKLSSAASAANATCDHMHDWFNGTVTGEYVSMAVVSDGSYGIPKGIVFSFPVTCKAGEYKIQQGLKYDEFIQKKIDVTTQELLDEKDMALQAVKD
mmetsp:Transcript_32485/g.29315  ORF Transcript_32485/g.29315 Transcript_32485/m.29315 type:complete len:357 (-) Transcript_32485:182-1252(-)|eukprot:CAMPEP_0114582426 /NCGR_PEP_ID=MMETSP0125-20121206/6412_1 /TAXON_ID=485358 ORGANISM="Aristerostoma sp., Strain ATCC 50986" /NCGR_SAMPLE_ID=MMETSP0125 /ASSEMBLY_ACC=CAM_ASM_000245 /LENGTH=356 /DNA_ID=CAMNT_0001775377 /DNA_START=6 /DNA_END=1076 /DNA_ORIENTATION=-